MPVRTIRRNAAGAAVWLSVWSVLSAQSPAPSQPTQFYPPGDAARAIAAAQAAAKKDGRHVLLDFGADWCPDCRVLGGLFEDPAVAPVVAANFHVVRIDVGRRDKNAELVSKYGGTSAEWIPAVVVLGPDGSTVAITNEVVRLTRRTTKDELIALLKSWSPKQRERELATFAERGVRVALRLERDRSGGRWLAGEFTPLATGTHLYGIDLPEDGVAGLGRPTRISITPGSALRATGAISADRPVVKDRIEELGVALPIYPAGSVTLRLPVAVDPNASAVAQVRVSYMACGPRGCLAPVINRLVEVQVR